MITGKEPGATLTTPFFIISICPIIAVCLCPVSGNFRFFNEQEIQIHPINDRLEEGELEATLAEARVMIRFMSDFHGQLVGIIKEIDLAGKSGAPAIIEKFMKPYALHSCLLPIVFEVARNTQHLLLAGFYARALEHGLQKWLKSRPPVQNPKTEASGVVSK